MDDLPTPTLAFLDYLATEKTSPVRHDYIAGQLFEIESLSPEHDRLAINIGSALYEQLQNHPGQVFTTEMKLWIPAVDVAYYPDVMVVCEPEDNHSEFKTRPCLIVEVLSSNTVATDRQEKFFAYQKIPTFQEYVLVAQDKIAIEVYRKDTLGQWQRETLQKKDHLYLKSLGLTLTLGEIYEDIFLG
jgi:Uma2 family endonuclease